MSLTSYRTAPSRDEVGKQYRELKGQSEDNIRLVDLAATYSPAP